MKKLLVFILILLVLLPSAWVLFYKFEGTPPDVEIKMPSVYLNKSYKLAIDVSDAKTGIRQIRVSILQQGKENVLLDKAYNGSGFLGFFADESVLSESFEIPVESWKYGMSDGEAIIQVSVTDRSWRRINKGNLFYAEKNVIIDSKPPRVKVLTKRHNLERGGSALVIYELFEDQIESGVTVGDNFFPGHPGMFDNEKIFTAFFALSHEQGRGTPISVTAKDPAGNVTDRRFHTYIREKKFKTDVLNIPARFLDNKISDFDVDSIKGPSPSATHPLLEKYLYINNEVRKKNVDTLLSVQTGTRAQKYWEGRFLQLKRSQKRAGYADKRIYKFKNKEIDRAIHLGIDLASTAHAPVEAANDGWVIFTGEVGIFGKTIVIDHGFGLGSLYAHLNEIDVNENDVLAKGQIIGYTGETGLAGGDHLHFSMIVHNVFVNPLEWWDPSWIKNNITSKIEAIKNLPSQ